MSSWIVLLLLFNPLIDFHQVKLEFQLLIFLNHIKGLREYTIYATYVDFLFVSIYCDKISLQNIFLPKRCALVSTLTLPNLKVWWIKGQLWQKMFNLNKIFVNWIHAKGYSGTLNFAVFAFNEIKKRKSKAGREWVNDMEYVTGKGQTTEKDNIFQLQHKFVLPYIGHFIAESFNTPTLKGLQWNYLQDFLLSIDKKQVITHSIISG